MFSALKTFPLLKLISKKDTMNKQKFSSQRCRVCQKLMDDCHDLGWILKGEGLVCFSCRKKLFVKTENRNDHIRIIMTKRRYKLLKSRYKTLKLPFFRELSIRFRSFFTTGTLYRKKGGVIVSASSPSIPVVELFEQNEDLSSLYQRFSEKSDTELAPVFLEHEEKLIDLLQKSSLYTLSICEDDWIRGMDPVSGIFSSWNIPVNILMKRNRNNQIEFIIRKWRRSRSKKMKTILIAAPFLSDEQLEKRLEKIRREFPELKPDLVLCLFREEENE